MDVIVVVAAILAALSVLVMVHELGHLIVAKLAGVEVEFFDIGVGPTLLSRTDRKGTAYNLKAIPLGGHAQLLDGWGSEIDDANRARSYPEAAAAWKLPITLAGSGLNFLVAFAVLLVLALGGATYSVAVIDEPTGKALEAGMRGGDEIVAVDGAATANWQDVGLAFFDRIGDTGSLAITVSRGGDRHTFALPIREWQSDRRFMNVFEDLGVAPSPAGVHLSAGSVFRRVGSAIEETFVLGITVAAAGFKMIFAEMSIVNFFGPLYLLLLGDDGNSLDWVDYARLFALFSIALGIINLLPGPVVDGVGVALATGELVTRKRATARVERNVRYCGFVVGFGPLVLCIGYEIARIFA